MLGSTVDLLNDIFLIAMILLTVVCVVGSIMAALCVVNRGSAASGRMQGDSLDDMGSQPGALIQQGLAVPIGSICTRRLQVPCVSKDPLPSAQFSIRTQRLRRVTSRQPLFL
jgi:hypothetical protein